ncbi:phosphatase PAP2 family protein [Galactobacter valiniphilus]|uniref:Phosphatase PAP2 family protein n=1 Tax=Galactobacter valiniphilus TaxID=2676122 RepID=A0A399JFF5_9MICC|nr:phosphatase PAP2 family protein [Galactobacter valiniphilus]RII43710.1 phosphatase PAP2 family protein [Galactobacter valiniphilus]
MVSPALPALGPAGTRGGGLQRATPALPILGLFAVAAAFAFVFWAFVMTVRGQWVDEQALVDAQRFLTADTAQAASLSWLNQLPEVVGLACAAGLVICAVVRRDVVVPLLAALAAGLAMIATQLLKHGLLSRPDLGVSEAWGNSFPSGHTTVAAAATVALVLAAPARARAVLAFLGAVASAATGAATVIMGWHRPSDVVGAFLVAAFCSLLGALAIGGVQAFRARLSPAPRPVRPPAGGWVSWLLPVLGAVAVVAAAVISAPGVAIAGQGGTDDPGLYVGAGLLFIAGAALIVFPLMELTSRRWLRG